MPPKKILLSFFLYIFHIKTKRNIAYKYLKTEIFQETQTSFSKANALNIKYLWTFTYNNWSVWGYNYAIKSLTSRKRYAQKTSACSTVKLHEKYSNSCEGKEYARRNLNSLYIYFSKTKAFLENFSESGYKFIKSLYHNFQFLYFC